MNRRWLMLSLFCVTGCAHLQDAGNLGQNGGGATNTSINQRLLGGTSKKAIEPRTRPLNFDLIPELHQ